MEGGSERAVRILIADDDAVVLALLESRLGVEFEIVGTAVDSDQAIALTEVHQPDAVVLDVEMPHGGGIRAAREIRERAPRTAIVALSADESRSGVLEMLDAGAMAYVRKGVPVDELVAKLRGAIAAHARLS